ncbi:histamine N-methyltransferase A-like [Asterias rubens]|uniref:histamine N-methyltransferase A-like n=1 Tax=Asterias rubens TaxID=7604 RepID=UPI0014550FBB|nr:histamine N-methyltransferase A-like [Asterias rubens]XP_033637196.1 histamine N-methyltransferase A-like [Asterias rubens]XP_033637197.1 histamine N-methyltransferase A-like [Asterias rubens]
MASIRPLTDDMEYYHRAFGVYDRVADRHNVLINWMETQLKEVVKTMGDVTGPMRALCIGPGDGTIENTVLKVLRSRTESSGRVNATVVEPVPDMVSLFKARIAADETSHQQGMSYAWKTQTLDEFRGEIAGKDEVKFHFISSVHSIYYVPDLEATMKDLYDRLEPGGVMMVIVVSENCGLGRLWKRFPLLGGARQHHPTSAEVEAACSNQNIPVSENFTIKVRSNITACFSKPEDRTEDANLLLNFFTHAVNFVQDAPAELQSEVVEYLGSDACTEKRGGDQMYFIGDWKALIVRRK